jgi:translation initiation factor IF-2
MYMHSYTHSSLYTLFLPQATVLDACLDKGRGIIADVLVQWGELSVGDAVVIGTSFGRVKSMEDHLVRLEE